MRGLILSGGRGTRLRPITHTSAKQLIPVANKPILHYGIEAMVEAGVPDIGIIVGETGTEVRQSVGDGSCFGARVTYIEQPEPLGLAHAVLTASEYLAGEPFVMYLGDNLIRDGISPLVAEFQERGPDAMVLLARVPEPQRFGVAELMDGRIVALAEKPAVPRSDYALVGVYMFGPAVHDAIAAIDYSARGELEITDAIQRMIDDGRSVVPHMISGWWKDTGRLEDLLEANRIILGRLVDRDVRGHIGDGVRLEGPVVIGERARLHRCTVRGPVVIGEGAVVDDAYIGPYTSISEGCSILGGEIENSIMLENSRIENVHGKIEASLIGKETEVCQSPARPRAFRLMLGDHSRVELV